MTIAGRALLRVTRDHLSEALGLPVGISVERVWETDEDKSMHTYTVCVIGAALPPSPDGWMLPYTDLDTLHRLAPSGEG